MGDYESWIEQEEEAEEMETLKDEQASGKSGPNQSTRADMTEAVPRSGNARTNANLRKSVILHDIEKPTNVGNERQSMYFTGDEQGRRKSESRVFPGVEIQSRETKIQSGKKQERIGVESRWPFAILGLLFLFGALAMCVLGIICIRTYFVLALYNGNVLPPGTFDACGPAGGAGGIVMLMIGAIIVGISIWQLYKLKDIRRRFLGYTQKV